MTAAVGLLSSGRFTRCLGLVAGTFLTLLLLAQAGRAADKPGSRFTGPWDLPAFRQAPRITLLDETRTVTPLYYEGEPYQGKPTRVFAYLARPEKVEGKRPAMVLVHGGGGSAF